MSENSSLLFHWKKQKREFKMRSLIGLSWEKVGWLKSWIKLNLKSLLSGQFRFDFIASSQSPTSWKGLELTVALVLRFLLAAQTLSLELFRPEGEEVEPLYGPKILSQSEDFIFPRKKEETSCWRWYLCKSIFWPSTFKNGRMLRDDVMSGPRFHWTLRKLTAFVGAIEQTAPFNSLSFVAHVGLEKRIYLSSLRLFLV